jgi:hypothetical protein
MATRKILDRGSGGSASGSAAAQPASGYCWRSASSLTCVNADYLSSLTRQALDTAAISSENRSVDPGDQRKPVMNDHTQQRRDRQLRSAVQATRVLSISASSMTQR